ncbi:MAG: hypothetical protein ACI39F_01865, partial [Acutalibacteraceae bacterium]
KRYRWTADGLNSAYFKDGETHRQAFRFGMMEAKIYTVNGAAKLDENGNPVYDKDGNIQQDPATAQGLWNGFWTCGNADMTEKTSAISFHESVFGWPYNGEIDICEAYNDTTQFKTYDYVKNETLKDENGLVFNYNNGNYYIKYDENGKTLITNGSGDVCVSYDTEKDTYVVAEDQGDFQLLNDDDGSQYIRMQKAYDIKQEKNSKGVMSNYVLDMSKKTIVDTDGNCYGTAASKATAQFHHNTGERVNPNLDTDTKLETVAGAKKSVHSSTPDAGYITNDGITGETTIGDTGYHVYGVYWTPTQFVYYVDNMITGVFDITSPEYRALRECPQYAILTFPIGGSMPGSPNPALQYADYLVDYVRIYQADDSEYGDTNSLDYHGSKGFPTLNEFDKGFDEENYRVNMDYYEPVIKAYSHINIFSAGNDNEIEISGENCSAQQWKGTPLRNSQACVSVRDSAKLTTKKFFDEGKYDIYLQGLSRNYGKDYAVTLNDTDIGSQLKMYSDHPVDKYNRSYGGMADAYVGTAEIVNGSHNFTLALNKTYQPNSDSNTVYNGGMVRAVIVVGNSKNTATVTIGEDSYLTPTTTVSPDSQIIFDNFYMTYDPNTNGGYHVGNVGSASFSKHAIQYNASSNNVMFLENRSQIATNPGGETDLRIVWDDHPIYDLKSGTYKLVAFVVSSSTSGTFKFTHYEDGNVSGTNGTLVGNIDFTNTTPIASYDNDSARAYEVGTFTIVNGDTDKSAFNFAPVSDGAKLTLHGLAAVPADSDYPTIATTTSSSTTTTTVTTTTKPGETTSSSAIATTQSGETKIVYNNFFMTYDPNTDGNHHVGSVGSASFSSHAVQYDSSMKNNLFLANRSQLATNPGGTSDLKIIWDEHPAYDLTSGTYKLIAFVVPSSTSGTFSFTQFEDGNVSGTNGKLVGNVDFTNATPIASYDGGVAKAYEVGNFTIENGDTDKTAITFAPVGDGKLTLHGLAAVPVIDDITVSAKMKDGASIRLNNVNGIRFYTEVDTEKVDSLRNAGYTVELGTLIAPADNIQDKELSFALETGKYVDVKFNSTTYYTEDDFSGIVGSLVNIKEKNITREFVGRGYVKVTDTEGNETITYADYAKGTDEVSSVANNTRSLSYLANSYKTDENSDYASKSGEIKALVDSWAAKFTID